MGSQYSCFILVYLLNIFFLLSVTVTIHPICCRANLIEQTCKSTKYYDLCVSSLKWDSSSPKADAKGLAAIMVRVAMANATATKAYLMILSSSQMANDTSTVMKECADRYAFASEALKSSLQDLRDDMYDYAYMHVLAAADYPNACRNAFKTRLPGLAYPPEIALRGDALNRICGVVLGIIDALGFR